MATKSIADINVTGKRVFMRVDFNCPIADGKVTNDRRIEMALPSIQRVLEQGGKLVLASHLGRPKGKGFEEEFSLAPVANRISELIGRPVVLGPQDVAGPDAESAAAAMNDGDVLLLENVRFHAGETMPDKAKKNDDGKLTDEQLAIHEAFVADLAKLGEVYVNDAFGTCHRKHASMYGVAVAIKAAGGPAVAGFLVEKEIRYLYETVTDPKRPFVAIMGGAKVSDKIKLIDSLLAKVDTLIIGGGMAYTLLKALGHTVGDSLLEEDQVEKMKEILDRDGDKILLPVDFVCTEEFTSDETTPVDSRDIPGHLMGLDCGPKTIASFSDAIRGAATIVWNGPVGVFEREAYAEGTRAVAQAIAEATDNGAVSVIGGGDSAAAVEQFGFEDRMSHISTGGGASLTYLEGKAMPPIDVLDQA